MDDLDIEYYDVRPPYISPTERYGLETRSSKRNISIL